MVLVLVGAFLLGIKFMIDPIKHRPRSDRKSHIFRNSGKLAETKVP